MAQTNRLTDTSAVKSELTGFLKIGLKPCCRLAMLLSVLKTIGVLQFFQNSVRLELKSSNPSLLKLVTPALKSMAGPINISWRQETTLFREKTYFLSADLLSSDLIMRLLGLRLTQDCCRKAFFASAFISSGSVTADKQYLLEIFHHDPAVLKKLARIALKKKLVLRLYQLEKQWVLVGRGRRCLECFYSWFQLNNAIMELENRLILKDLRENANRLVNCETGNLKKVVSAADSQMQCIVFIRDRIGLSSLTDRLRQAAELRLKHPDASLAELSALSKGRFTKSALNHCFREIGFICKDFSDKRKANEL
ncbi:MAG: DNA-binding protein WhiA [Candidatus Wallbacteria bacterium]|nr:DNA-binding protein WhiA [Candidatus Wallbacteria bacterium]